VEIIGTEDLGTGTRRNDWTVDLLILKEVNIRIEPCLSGELQRSLVLLDLEVSAYQYTGKIVVEPEAMLGEHRKQALSVQIHA